MLSFDVGARQQPAELTVAFKVLAQEQQPKWLMRIGSVFEIDIGADNGLYARRNRLTVKLYHPEEVVQVGQRNGGHSLGSGGSGQIRDADNAVGQRELGMNPKMDEGHVHGLNFYSVDCLGKAICN